MEVRCNRWVGFFYLLLSLLLGGIVTAVSIAGEFDPLGKNLALILEGVMGLGTLITFWGGVNMLTGRVYFRVDQSSLIVHAAVGPLKRTFQFQSLDDLKVDRNQLFLKRDGTWKKIAIEYLVANRKDWEAFVQYIRHPG